jgi:ABC-type sugar transport system ATPase subunit
MTLGNLTDLSLAGLLRRNRERRAVDRFIEDLHVRPARRDVEIDNLSGGNQQKVLIGRAMMGAPRVLVLMEPTRGVDIGARARIHKALLAAKEQGCGVLICSTELDDLRAVCDRAALVEDGSCTEFMDAGSVHYDEMIERIS